jgi:hypothetical protein
LRIEAACRAAAAAAVLPQAVWRTPARRLREAGRVPTQITDEKIMMTWSVKRALLRRLR